MFKKTDKTPLFVRVIPGRWDAFGGSLDSFRHAWLFNVLKMSGGIHESVPPGWYDFNVKRKGLRLYSTLEPHQEK